MTPALAALTLLAYNNEYRLCLSMTEQRQLKLTASQLESDSVRYARMHKQTDR